MFIANLNYIRSVIQSFVNYTAVFNALYEADYCLERSLDDLNKKDLLYNASLVVTPNSYKEGLLYNVFPSKKNILLNSGYFNLSPWTTGGATITPNAGPAPDGTSTAYLYNDTGASDNAGAIIQAFTATSNILTCSIYLKASATTIDRRLALRNSTTATIFDTLIINLNTGVFTGAGWTVILLPNNWYRCIYTRSTGFSIGNTMQFYTARTSGAAVGATDQWFAWGAQVEEGYNVSTYSQTYASIIPTFTRNSTATRLNSSGNVEVVPSQNLLTYSEQFNNANWAKSNASVTVDTAIAPDGTLTADSLIEDTALSVHFTNNAQNGTVIASQNYTFSVYVNRTSTRNVSISIGASRLYANFISSTGVIGSYGADGTSFTFGAYTSTIINSNWIRVSVSGTALVTQGLYSRVTLDNTPTAIGGVAPTYTGNGTSGVIIWGAQTTMTSSVQPYFPTTTRFNIPRANYLVGDTCPTLFLEQAATNNMLNSEDISLWTAINSPIISTNVAIAPNGTMTADSIQSNNSALFQSVLQTRAITSNNFSTAVTFSIFVKKEASPETRYGGMALDFAASGAILRKVAWIIIDAYNGTAVLSSTAPASPAIAATVNSIKVEDYNTYWRISMTATDNGTALIATSPFVSAVYYGTLSTDGTTNNATVPGSARTIWGAQLEVIYTGTLNTTASGPTSYIPTTTAIVTRTAESLIVPTPYTSNLITSLGGTWLIDLKNAIEYIRDVPSAGSGMFIGDGAAANIGNSIVIRIAVSTISYLSIYKYVSGAATPLYTLTNANSKIVIKWDGIYINVFVNGVKVVTNSVFTTTNMNNMIYSVQSPTNIKTMALYPLPLTDAQCLSLSTQ